jgi:hypothetical protein
MAGKPPKGKPPARGAELTSASFDADVRAPEHGSSAPPHRSLAEKITRRLKGAPAAERAQFDFEAPLRALFAAAHPPAQEETGGFSLAFSLRQSAQKIRDAQDEMRKEGARLAGKIEERRRGEHQLVVNTVRLLIALVWGFLAFRLDREALAAQIFGTPIFGGAMPVADAQILSRVFMTLAIAGVGGAMIGGWLTMATGGASNNALRAAAARLGAEAAEIAKEFDKALDQYRARMDRRLAKAADAVEELSRMHMTALESAAFFTDVQFLTDPDRDEAARKFRGYLASAARGGGEALSIGAIIALLCLGFLVGIFVANIGAGPASSAPAAAAGSLLKYPLALLAVAGLGLVYAVAGVVLDTIGGSITSSAAAQARDEALDSLRAAFVAGNAPRVDAIIRRIEDAMDVYKARLGSASGGATSAHHVTATPSEDEPAWRRAPEGPRFVAQSFLAAPESFRADPVAAPQRRFFSSKKGDDAAPKQSFSGDETPPWLKE